VKENELKEMVEIVYPNGYRTKVYLQVAVKLIGKNAVESAEAYDARMAAERKEKAKAEPPAGPEGAAPRRNMVELVYPNGHHAMVKLEVAVKLVRKGAAEPVDAYELRRAEARAEKLAHQAAAAERKDADDKEAPEGEAGTETSPEGADPAAAAATPAGRPVPRKGTRKGTGSKA